jgi:hypothetical protein
MLCSFSRKMIIPGSNEGRRDSRPLRRHGTPGMQSFFRCSSANLGHCREAGIVSILLGN